MKTAAEKPAAKPAPGYMREAGANREVFKAIDFVLDAPHAKAVYLVGDFNDWDRKRTPLQKDGDGKWHRNLSLSPGRHEYRFIVDGEWISDPNATESVQNEFGTDNSIVRV